MHLYLIGDQVCIGCRTYLDHEILKEILTLRSVVNYMKSKEQLIEQAYCLAFKYEAELGSCPQCVLAALNETLEVGDETTIKSADVLAGGSALSTRGTCGALVGGLLALGSLTGRTYNDFKLGKTRRRVFRYAKKIVRQFY